MKTFYVRPNVSFSNYVLTTIEGETTAVKFDWSAKASAESTSVSSAAWSVESGSATVSGAALSSGIASAQIATASADRNIIKVAATMADGQIDIVLLTVICSPLPDSTSDYV